MKRIPAMILALLTAAALLVGCGTSERKIQAEPNTSYNADRYPYVLRTESATWYLAKDDIEMMGEDAFFENLYALIDDAEADFKDARKALKGYIPDEIPPVDILTDFCNRTPISAIAAAYYNENVNFIKLFYGWDAARATLTHEYVHYLTVHCAENPIQYAFWGEGVADYVAIFVCENRSARSVNMMLTPEDVEQAKEKGAWDAEKDCVDLERLYRGCGAVFASGEAVGVSYFAVCGETIERSEAFADEPNTDQLSFYEAAGMIGYLVETYGKDAVFSNWNIKPTPFRMKETFGKTFEELYRDWAVWNAEQCKMLGIDVP